MEELQPVPLLPERAGASLAAGGLDEQREFDDELPMVVWLRGTEPYAAQFELVADEVMAELGIKRSRLTQISGKELRVGRMRIGRYVRPVYRKDDVEAYKAWTRSTATHQRASSAIKEAAEVLSEQGKALEAVVSAQLTELAESLFATIDKHSELAVESQARQLERWEERFHSASREIAEQNRAAHELLVRKVQENAQGLHQRFAEITRLHDAVTELMSTMRTTHTGLAQALKLMLEQQRNMAAKHQSSLDAVRKDLARLEFYVADKAQVLRQNRKVYRGFRARNLRKT